MDGRGRELQQVGKERRFWWRALDAPHAPAGYAPLSLQAGPRPTGARRDIGRRRLRGFFSIAACCLLGWGLFNAAFDPGKGSLIWSGSLVLEKLAHKAGLEIVQISVTGQRYTPDKDIYAQLRLNEATSLLSFDAAEATRRIESLPWIAAATVRRVLPGEVQVRVWEREPHAIWLDRGRRVLLDRTGKELAEIGPASDVKLMLLAGFAAPAELPHLDALLADNISLRSRLAQASWIEGRRWQLILTNGTVLELPAENPAAALARLALHDGDGTLTSGSFARVDLRFDDRVIVGRDRQKLAGTSTPYAVAAR